jgi:hypothetical protein
MASTRRQVRFTGLVRGEGQEAECGGWCLEVSLGGTPPAYTRYQIDTLSKALPDGIYTVFAHGTNQPVRYVGGDWLAQF